MPKPTMIYQGEFSKSWYATRAYKERDNGGFVVTGQKEDITEQMLPILDSVYEQGRKEMLDDLLNEAQSDWDRLRVSDPWSPTPSGDIANWLRSKKESANAG